MGCVISIDAVDVFQCVKKASQYSPIPLIEVRLTCAEELPQGLRPTILTPICTAPGESLLLQLAARKPSYLDVPSTVPADVFARLKEHFPEVKLIASFHEYTTTPDDVALSKTFQKLRSLPCDAIKITTFAHSSIDGLRMLDFLQKHSGQFPLTAFCMGEKGSFTRVLQPIYGGLFTYSALEAGRETASGQIPVDELYTTYHFPQLSPISLSYALIGDPLQHSLSHLTHNAMFRRLAMDAVYVKIMLTESEFAQTLYYLRRLGFAGLSITMPLKFCFDKSLPVNTLDIRGERIVALNTDGIAAIEAIENELPVSGKKVLVIGAGATGAAIASQAVKQGADVSIQSRTQEKALALAQKLGCRVAVDEADAIDVIVNATPADLSVGALVGVALDVRNLAMTPFLEHAMQAGARVISGQNMWLRQAAKQLALWCVAPPVTLVLPPSKSQTLRAIVFASLAHGSSKIDNCLQSPDTESMILACQAFGAQVQRHGNNGSSLSIIGVGSSRALQSNVIDVGNSGIVLRFIGGVAALFDQPLAIIGDDSTRQRRSCTALLDGLTQLGARVSSHQGHTPLSICGPIRSGCVTIDGADSQPVSALLIACSLLEGPSQITVRVPGEKPWVRLTVNWLRTLGVDIQEDETSGALRFHVRGRPAFSSFMYTVPGDLSALAFIVVAAVMQHADVIVEGVDLADLQGDKKVVQILEAMGARFSIDPKRQRLRVRGPQQLQGMTIDVNDCIDAVPILAVVGTYAEGVTTISGAAIARDKECDRLHAITVELRKMGARVEEREDGLTVYSSSLHAACLESYNDHRIAMSLAVAALRVQGKEKGSCTIAGSECVRKSYPGFFTDLARIGTGNC